MTKRRRVSTVEAAVGEVEAWNWRRHVVVGGDDADAEGLRVRHRRLLELTEMPPDDDGLANRR